MPGQLDFGNHLDAAFGGIGHHLADFVLRVVTAVGRSVVPVRSLVMTYQRLPAHRTHTRQFGVSPDLDAPSLVVGQMPVKGVEFVERHDVDKPLDVLHGIEVARHVEHCAAVAETGFVADLHDGNPSAVDELAQGLHTVEHGPGRAAADGDAARRHAQSIRLARERGVQLQIDAPVHGFVRHDGLPHPGFGQVAGTQPGDGLQRRVIVADPAAAADAEHSVARFDRHGTGDDIDSGRRCFGTRRKEEERGGKEQDSLHGFGILSSASGTFLLRPGRLRGYFLL